MAEKILIVDDERLILKSVQEALSKAGYVVRTARNRDEFLSVIRKEDLDLVLLDIHLEDITKEEIMEIAREHVPGIRFLVMSGSSVEESVHFIQKPFRVSELKTRIREIFHDRA